jgi:hypothetical protein
MATMLKSFLHEEIDIGTVPLPRDLLLRLSAFFRRSFIKEAEKGIQLFSFYCILRAKRQILLFLLYRQGSITENDARLVVLFLFT